MKAFATGLEVEVLINKDELKTLENKSLDGLMRFREVNSDCYKRDIPIKISYKKDMKNSVDVSIKPKRTYFGDAQDVEFFINEYYYDKLGEHFQFCDRYLSPNGKLWIKVNEDR